MSSSSRRSNNDHSAASVVPLDTSHPDAVVQAHHMAPVVFPVMSGRRLSRLDRFSTLQLSVAHMVAQPAIFPGRIALRHMPRELLPVRYHSCTRITLSLLKMTGTVNLWA